MTRIAAVLAGLAGVLLVAACGGSSSSSTTTTSATEQWANGLCAATNTYLASLKSMSTTLTGGDVDKSSLQAVVTDAKTSTQAFADSVKALGSPPVSDSEAKQIFEGLESELRKDAAAIEEATANVSTVAEVLNAIGVVGRTFASAGTQIKAAFDEVKQLDAKSEVAEAFESAPACKTLTGS
jgi:hypothetical protein